MDQTASSSELETAAVNRLRVLLVPVARDLLAVEMTWVREVVSAPLVTELPTAAQAVLGVFNLRGEIVPMFDTAALVGFGSVRTGSFAAVVETSMGPAGLIATGIPESVDLGESISATETDGTIGRYAIGTRIATLLDVDVLLAPARVAGWAA